MRKLIIFFVLLTVGVSLHAQRMGSCSGAGPGDRIYLTIYGAPGIGKYKFEPVSFVTDKAYFESKSLLSLQAGLTLHYRFDRFNLGLGAAYHSFSGKMDEELLQNADLKLRLLKAYLSLEIPVYSDSFADFGVGANAGSFMIDGQYYTAPKIPAFFEAGLYYNIILNSYSSLMMKLYYGKSYSNNTFLNTISKQQTSDFSLQIGFRTWF